MSGRHLGASWARSTSATVAPVAMVALAACSTAVPGSRSEDEGTTAAGAEAVSIAVPTEPETLNPVLGYARYGNAKIFDGLVELGADLEPVPGLATALPEVSDDGLTYTFALREGVRFHDGHELDAADVAFTYRAALDPELASPTTSDLAAIESVQTPDTRTVVFHLKYPYAPFVSRATLGIVPEHLLTGEDLASTEFNQQPVGTGPYQVDQWRQGERLVLTANEEYWGEVPAVRRAVFVFIADDAARAARLAGGDVDGTVLPPTLLPRFEGEDRWTTMTNPSADFRAIMMPSDPDENPVTADRAIRQALSFAADREQIVAGILAGNGKPAYSPIAPEQPAYNDVVEVPHDVERARSVLEEAGWVTGEGGVRVKDGQRAEFTLLYPAGDTLRQQIALAFEADAERIGVGITVDSGSWEAIEPRMRQDAVVFGTGTPYDPDFSTYGLFHSSLAYQGFQNPGGYANAEVDALLEQARRVRDADRRHELYGQLQAELAADQPWVFLTFLDHTYVIRDAWEGFVQTTEPHEHGFNGGPWWNLQDWTVR